MARLQKGQVPDGSGNPIGDVILSDIYLVLLGRIGDQVAHGGKRAGGTLTLASTTNPAKGSIYLGNAKQTVYDEVNERIGVNQPTPAAKVHIKTGATANTYARPASDTGTASLAWSVVGAASPYLALNDSGPDTAGTSYLRFTDNVGGASAVQVITLAMATDPGVDSGFVVHVTLRGTNSTNAKMLVEMANTGGGTVFSRSFGFPTNAGQSTTEGNVTSSLVQYSIVMTGAECALVDFGTTQNISVSFSGASGTGATFDCSQMEFQLPPAGGTFGDTLQQWENPSSSNLLAYANDSNLQATLQLSGTPPLRLTTAPEFDVGTPAVGQVWAAADTEGTGVWAAASGLHTLVEHRFQANGPYRTGDEVDGAWTPKKAMTLAYVRLYRRVGGTAGSTQVTLTQNGTTMLSADPTIAFNAGASATADGTVSVTAIAAGDRIAPSAVAVDTGLPRDASWTLLVGAY